jgi:hypothetical protein
MRDHVEALGEALKRGDTQGARDIIRKYPMVSHYDEAFVLAASRGNVEILKMLDKDGDDVIHTDKHQMYYKAFANACEDGHCETARYIADNHKQFLPQHMLLFRMYQFGQQDYVDEYAEKYDKVGYKRRCIYRAVLDAFREGDVKSAIYFIDLYDPNVTVKDFLKNFGPDIIFDPLFGGHISTMKCLVEHGFDLSLREDYGEKRCALEVIIDGSIYTKVRREP